MINIKPIDEFLLNEKENKKEKYKYGCVMLYFHFPEIEDIHSKIDAKDVYFEEGDGSYGLEYKPHTTLLYGLHEEVSIDDIKNILEEFQFGTCKIYNISLFKNEKYDVLKFDVEGKNLKKCNSKLSKLPHTSDFPDYHPHLTIAYLSKGMGKKYTEMFEDVSFKLKPSHVIYSLSSGDEVKINIYKRHQ